ncbi:bifunctional 4-hydroxy-2-oxoglutarate aldolase/2-dehydro-3-deoxy-phosphogluconate aldolase [Bacillus sp. JJ1521]|uniref:bifunctional 4-hydroxy-2-oxoglutarate aldolase/2-dehydro-3-deoxy-phosphogluconate aldolase n=1 Tax=Bacillus sp. JJ1521 TaxID=3122957 RepID=UPI002FFEF22F
MNLVEQIKENKIVSVIRGASIENIIPIANALFEGGVKTLEITVETPKACQIIEKVSDTFGDKMIIGAGTVLDAETARIAIMSGAKFIFSPTVNVKTIKMTKRYGVISIPGALTPTEILTAYESGADIIKVFPAHAFGPGYLKSIHGPLPHIPLMPTGGVDLSNIQNYLKAGAFALGIGSSLVNTKNIGNANFYSDLRNKAKLFSNETRNQNGVSA